MSRDDASLGRKGNFGAVHTRSDGILLT